MAKLERLEMEDKDDLVQYPTKPRTAEYHVFHTCLHHPSAGLHLDYSHATFCREPQDTDVLPLVRAIPVPTRHSLGRLSSDKVVKPLMLWV